MSRDQGFCKIVADDESRTVSKFIVEGLGIPDDEVDEFCTIGFVIDKSIVGGIMFEGNPSKSNLWLNIFTTNQRWCCKRVIKEVFSFAFVILKVNRLSIMVNSDNKKSFNFVQRLGFKKEGRLRCYRNGKDVYILGMLKKECKYL